MKKQHIEECGSVRLWSRDWVSTCSLVAVGQRCNRVCVVAKMNGTMLETRDGKKNDKQVSAGQKNIEFVLGDCPETVYAKPCLSIEQNSRWSCKFHPIRSYGKKNVEFNEYCKKTVHPIKKLYTSPNHTIRPDNLELERYRYLKNCGMSYAAKIQQKYKNKI